MHKQRIPSLSSSLAVLSMKVIETNTTSYGFSLLSRILSWDIRIHDFLSSFKLFLQPLLNSVSTKCEARNPTKNQNPEPLNQPCFLPDKGCHEGLCRGDIDMVMDRLGIVYDAEGDKLHQERFGAEEISKLFDEEPSLEEVREAFDVFDENKDGLIDAAELKRVLCCLGLEDRSEEECRMMIQVFDENGDGHIDFTEFEKFMEKCFC